MNCLSTKYFHFLAFSGNLSKKHFLSGVFFFIYFIGLLLNVFIVMVICLDYQLHTPLYVFLCNLSIVDVSYTTIVLPKLLDMLLSGNNMMTYLQCFTQMFFLLLVVGTENMILALMAYDRYVVICDPLNYHHIFGTKKFVPIMIRVVFLACLNSIFFTYSASCMSFCHSTTIQQFFCDAKALTKISCTGAEIFFTVFGVEAMFFGLGPLLCSLMSYIKIISVILPIKSKDRRKKAF
uniref:Olfactory receptor n=1 Tax=Pyxicephalus adspersus TaxID=30357 RepID=A0AAV2ZWS9_PYXAD|nr:TPA: hypothetical protein GDO54_015011 [Pyxicephalus adspersus]